MEKELRLSALQEEDYKQCLAPYFEKSDDIRTQIGFILPPSVDDLKTIFPIGSTYKLLPGGASCSEIQGIIAVRTRFGKANPKINVGFVVEYPELIREVYPWILNLAKSERKLIIAAYLIGGYEKEKIETLLDIGFIKGAATIKTTCLYGKYYDTVYLYHDIENQYEESPRLTYAEKGDLYPSVPVEKHNKPLKLRFRLANPDDAGDIAEFVSQQNTFRTLAQGVYEGFVTRSDEASLLEQRKKSGLAFTIACVDTEKKKVIGLSNLDIVNDQVSRHVGHLGVFVSPEYQGLGVGTTLLNEIDLLARRLHLESLVLSYFGINEPGKLLYEKSGYEYRGQIPGWLSSTYVNEIFMQKML
jgi:RimJ/RimL family protein N-acetyltransferase